MAWKVTIDDKSILLDDLSEDDFVAATKDFEDINWLKLYISPGVHPGAFYELLKQCAFKLEVPAPSKPKNIKESIALLKHVEQVDDDLPTAFSEGGLPLGDSVDEPVTTTSSTSTERDSGTPKGHAKRQ